MEKAVSEVTQFYEKLLGNLEKVIIGKNSGSGASNYWITLSGSFIN